MVTVPYTVEVGSYWVRQKVEPCLMKNPMAKLHTNLEPGTYVEILQGLFTQKDEVFYKVHKSMEREHKSNLYSEVTTTKTFRIYFEKVTDEAELGLITLAEQE